MAARGLLAWVSLLCGLIFVVGVFLLDGIMTKGPPPHQLMRPRRRLARQELSGGLRNSTKHEEAVTVSAYQAGFWSNATGEKGVRERAAPDDRPEPLPLVWHRLSQAAAVLLAVCCSSCWVFCAAISLSGRTGVVSDAGLSRNTHFLYDPLDESVGDVGKKLRGEARLMLLLPFIALLGLPGTTCDDGPPIFLYCIYLPFLVRCKVLEYRWLVKFGDWQLSAAVPFFFGALEHMDFFTDGLFPLQAYKCDPQVTEHFAIAFQQSVASILAPVIGYVHFWGLALLTLVAAVLSQQAAVSWSEDLVVAADISGMAALAERWGKTANMDASFSFYIFITKVSIENCVQLWLQASFFCLTFERTSSEAKVKLLISMGLGLVSAFLKSLKQMFNWPMVFGGNPVLILTYMMCAYVLPSIVSICFVAWACAKLYFSYMCDSHLWNLSSGCVAL